MSGNLTFTTQTSSYFVLNPYGWQFQKIWIGDKKSFSLTKSVLHAVFRWQICHRKFLFFMKKAAMISSSLLLKMSVPYRNRTYNRVLGVRVRGVLADYMIPLSQEERNRLFAGIDFAPRIIFHIIAKHIPDHTVDDTLAKLLFDFIPFPDCPIYRYPKHRRDYPTNIVQWIQKSKH